MKAPSIVALSVGLPLIAAQFLALWYDARHAVAHYRGEVAIAVPAHR